MSPQLTHIPPRDMSSQAVCGKGMNDRELIHSACYSFSFISHFFFCHSELASILSQSSYESSVFSLGILCMLLTSQIICFESEVFTRL